MTNIALYGNMQNAGADLVSEIIDVYKICRSIEDAIYAMYGNLQDAEADLVFEIIVRKLQAYNLIMQAGQEVAEALELHALFAIFTEKV